MFIQNPVWKSVPATNLTAPVLEGTVLSKEGEVVWAPDGISSDATPYGVVTETINILPPTMLINVAVGGTIDLKLPGNEVAQDYPEDILTTMWDNINFIQFSELDGQDIEPVTRLEYFLKKAAEGGGGSSGGLVEIKNVAPFQVPDLVNGGTRLFNPANDSIYAMRTEADEYTEISNAIISNETPPGYVTSIEGGIKINTVITRWNEVRAYENADATENPHFCVAPSTAYFFGDEVPRVIFKPASIVYKYTTGK